MQYSTWRHIPDDSAEDGSDNSLRNVGYGVKFKHAVLFYTASHPRIWSDKSSFKMLRLKNTQRSLQSGMPGSNIDRRGRFCDGLGSSIMVQYSLSSNIALHSQITAKDYVEVDRLGNQVHPMIQTLLPKKDAVFQGDNAPIHTA
jgi:hypothetical protein